MIDVDGVKVPDPKVSNPELFDLKNPDSPVVQFANAFGIKPEEVGDLTPKLITSIDGKQFVVLIDKNRYPLLIIKESADENWILAKATEGNLGPYAGAFFGETTTSGYFQDWAKEREVFRKILNNFNLYVSDYDLMWFTPVDPKWGLRPSETEFNFKNFDEGRALNNEKTLIAQTLLQSNTNYMPKWQNDINPNNAQNRERIRKIGITQIETVIKHAPDVKYWGVISELEHPSRSNYWVTAMGGLDELTWLKDFYVTAHNANPVAQLFYSDFDIEFGGTKADRIFDIIKTLKEMGTPINAVAFQFHLNGKDFIDPNVRVQKMETLREEIRRYKEIGIEVIAPEMDIAMMNISSNEKERFRIQAEIEYDLIKTLLEEDVRIISHFGGTDATNWRNQSKYGGGPDSDATPFMEDGSRKPNYYADMKAIINFLSK